MPCGLTAGDEVPGCYVVGRYWSPLMNPPNLPPDEAWLQASNYGDEGWSCELLLYESDAHSMKARKPGCSVVTLKVESLLATVDDHRFKVIYTPLPGVPNHCDLVCFDPNGVKITEAKPIKATLKKYRKQLLAKPADVFNLT